MKNSKILMFLSLSIVLFSFSSCGDPEKVIFNGEPGDPVLVTFGTTSIDLQINKDAVGDVKVNVNTTTKAPQDRTFSIEVLEGENMTTADPATYEIPTTVTIPANKYVGTFTITGTDIGVEIAPKIVTIKLTSTNPNIILEDNVAVVNVYEVCEVPDDFLVGKYMIADVTATIGPGNNSANFESGIVDIKIGDTPTTRVFTVVILPGIGSAEEVTLNLVCNQFVLGLVETNIYCTADVFFAYNSAAAGGYTNSLYDLEDIQDSYTINYTEDINASCGGPFLSSFSLTKIQ